MIVKPVTNIVLYGASGHAHTMARIFMDGHAPHRLCNVIAFIDDEKGGCGEMLDCIPIISFEQWRALHCEQPAVVAVGLPSTRRRLVERMINSGGLFTNLYQEPQFSRHSVGIGVGTGVDPDSFIGPQTCIGNHVQIMPKCSIGHDVVVHDYVTISPGCVVSGHVVIEEEVLLGAGTIVINGRAGAPLVIGRGSLVSAGSVVTKSVPAGSRVAGNPARPLREIALQRRGEKEADRKNILGT